jgi:ABC-2 type transport system ATP-binding protein
MAGGPAAGGAAGRGAAEVDAPVLVVRGITKRFGARTAVGGVDFDVGRGELLAIIGPNGAGKTTLLSILAGVARADDGTLGTPGGEAGRIGWVPQHAAVYSKLTVAQNLRLFARLEQVADPQDAVERMLDQTDLRARADDELGRLSGGNRQRVNIAVGLLADPAVLLLDEPSAALDPRQRQRLWAFINELTDAGTSIVFATHDIAEAERHADRLLVLADGELLFDGTPTDLKAATEAVGHGDLEEAFVAFLKARGH